MRPRFALPPRGFRQPSKAKRPCPCPRPELIETLTRTRGIRISDCRRMAVMHQTMGRGVMPEKHRRVNRDAQPVQPPIAPVDKFMRAGVGDLPEPLARPQRQYSAFPPGQPAVPGYRPDYQRKGQQMRQPKDEQQRIGGGKFGPKGYLFMADRLGADAAFSKPVDQNRLLNSVRALCEQQAVNS